MGLKIARKQSSVLAVPTSSMGDIAFLLIIFFLLTSKFMQESHIECELPTSQDMTTLEDETVSIMVDKNGKVWLQGEEVAGTDAKTQAESLKTQLEELRPQQKDPEKFTVMFKVHKDLNAAQYNEVIKKMAEAGVRISFIGE